MLCFPTTFITTATATGTATAMGSASAAPVAPSFTFIPFAVTADTPVWQQATDLTSALFAAQSALARVDRATTTADADAAASEAAAAVAEATQVWQDGLRPTIGSDAGSVVTWLETALTQAQTAVDARDAAGLALARGRVSSGLAWLSLSMTDAALARDDVDAAATWLRLREYRRSTTVETVADVAAAALASVRQRTQTAEQARPAIAGDLRDTAYFRLREALTQIDSAAAGGLRNRAAEWTGQVQGYLALLADDLTAQLGPERQAQAQSLGVQIEQALLAGQDADLVALSDLTAQVRQTVLGYQPVQFDDETLQRRAELLVLYLDLVGIEYRDGVRDGQIKIAIEYQEAQTFRDQAQALLEELSGPLTAADPAAAARLDAIVAEMDTLIAAMGSVPRVEALSKEGSALAAATLDVSSDTASGPAAFTLIDTLLNDMLQAAIAGDFERAEQTRIEAYAIFETGPEARLINRAPVLTQRVESNFWEGRGGQPGLRVLLKDEASEADLRAAVERVQDDLDEAESLLSSGLSSTLAAVNSAAIIIREGLEAVLVVGAILGYLRSSGAPKRFSGWVGAGVLGAIALSLVTWWAARELITITAANREIIEGVASLVAVAVLFYVTNWLFHKTYVVDWLTYVREKAGAAVSSGSALVLAGLGFTIVYREGFETVLFYQALLFDANAAPVLVGFLIGSVVIGVVAWLILRMSRRIALKPFFTATTVVMLVLAFGFTGSGVRELQEAGVVDVTLLTWMPESIWLMELGGIYPTVQTTLAQVAFVLAVAGSFVLSLWLGRRRRAGTGTDSSAPQPRSA